MAFSFHDFVADTLRKMVEGKEPDYQIMQLAAHWYDKGVLKDADLEEVDKLIADREKANEPVVLPEITEDGEAVLTDGWAAEG